MINKDNKIDRFLMNQTEEGKNQIIKFLLNDNPENCNKGFIFRSIEEYSRMYPELKEPTAILDDSLGLNGNTFSESTNLSRLINIQQN